MSSNRDERRVITAMSHGFLDDEYIGLDNRWNLLANIRPLATYLAEDNDNNNGGSCGKCTPSKTGTRRVPFSRCRMGLDSSS